jgi:hypothetical protein
MRYEVKENNVLEIFIDGQDAPHVRQYHWPSGDAWTAEEAASWGAAYVESMNNPDAPLAGVSAEQPTINRADVSPVDGSPTFAITPEIAAELQKLGWSAAPAEEPAPAE